MKYLIILADGAADEPCEILGGKTPLTAARKPHIDRLCQEGAVGRLETVPAGFHPGSEIAHLGLLGYDIGKVFEGRGSLEAASMGIPIEDGEVAMRCNLICITPDGIIKNQSAGNISNEEAEVLISYLNEQLGDDRVRFFPGVSYRHLLKIKGGNKMVECTPPHDVPGQTFRDKLPRASKPEGEETAKLLGELILKSMEILPKHPINLKRAAEGKDMATAIWPWSLGYRPSMEPMTSKFPIKTGSVISAVDLIFGIGVYAGLDKVEVPGATGLWDTNYEGKCEAALRELKSKDFVFLHVEATDEAGHDGNPELKTRCVEYLDERVVKRVMEEISTWNEPVRIAMLPDHPTPCRLRTHSMTPVPFFIWEPGSVKADTVETWNEDTAFDGRLGLLKGDQFIKTFFQDKI